MHTLTYILCMDSLKLEMPLSKYTQGNEMVSKRESKHICKKNYNGLNQQCTLICYKGY